MAAKTQKVDVWLQKARKLDPKAVQQLTFDPVFAKASLREGLKQLGKWRTQLQKNHKGFKLDELDALLELVDRVIVQQRIVQTAVSGRALKDVFPAALEWRRKLLPFAQSLAAAFWFHPLSWWALGAFRHDQELACDASVLRQHGEQRRAYAQAMLKTPLAMLALPVGCAWSSRHPLTERIAMLKLPRPDPRRRMSGVVTMLLLALAVSSLAFAASQPGPQASSSGPAGPDQRYTLKLVLGVDGQPAHLHATSCLKSGEYYTDTQTAIGTLPPWHGRYTVVPAEHGMLEVQAHLSGGSLPAAVDPGVRTHPGQTATIQVGQQVAGKDGKVVEDHTIKIELTPSIGC